MALKILKTYALTGGRCRVPAVALNRSPARVLAGKESVTEESSRLLLIDFLCPSLVSLNVTLFWDDLAEDAGEPLAELSQSVLGDDLTILSGFCTTEKISY